MSYNTIVVNLIISLNRNLDKPSLDKLGFAGGNTGNIIFTEAVKEQVRLKKEIWINPTALDNVENPAVIIPAANFIISGNQDSLADALIRFMERTDCPITLAGLGAQNTPLLNTPGKLVRHLSETKKRCFKMLAERAVTLGIRGEFTAECLDLLGIHNYRIIGCPSLYKYMNGSFPRLPPPSLKNVQITVTPASPSETKILEMGYSLNAEWLMQMSTDLIQCTENAYVPDKAAIYNSFPEISLSLHDLSSYITTKGKAFWTIDDWNHYYQSHHLSFAFGSRFHGNISALRNGIPALWITHDSRTAELIQALYLPHITQEKFMHEIKNPEQLLGYCDYSHFYQNYPALLTNYIDFLKENYLEPICV